MASLEDLLPVWRAKRDWHLLAFGASTQPGATWSFPRPARASYRYLLSASIRRMGSSARLRDGSGQVISGSMFKSASYAFSSVFIFMNRHSPQKQLSVGPGMNVLSGISLL